MFPQGDAHRVLEVTGELAGGRVGQDRGGDEAPTSFNEEQDHDRGESHVFDRLEATLAARAWPSGLFGDVTSSISGRSAVAGGGEEALSAAQLANRSVGDLVSVTAEVVEYYDLTELYMPSDVTLISTGHALVPLNTTSGAVGTFCNATSHDSGTVSGEAT